MEPSIIARIVIKLGHPWFGIHHSFIPKALTGLSGELTLSGFKTVHDEENGIDINGWELGFNTAEWSAVSISPIEIQINMMYFEQAVITAQYAQTN